LVFRRGFLEAFRAIRVPVVLALMGLAPVLFWWWLLIHLLLARL
jgi:hypothetical protein